MRNFSYLNIASRNWKQVRVAIDEGSNKLSTTSINNYKTSENITIRTTEAPNNNYVINNNLAASTRKEKFRTNTASFKLGSTETELNKRENFSPIIRELDTPVKPSRVYFDVVIDKPSTDMQKIHKKFGLHIISKTNKNLF